MAQPRQMQLARLWSMFTGAKKTHGFRRSHLRHVMRGKAGALMPPPYQTDQNRRLRFLQSCKPSPNHRLPRGRLRAVGCTLQGFGRSGSGWSFSCPFRCCGVSTRALNMRPTLSNVNPYRLLFYLLCACIGFIFVYMVGHGDRNRPHTF